MVLKIVKGIMMIPIIPFIVLAILNTIIGTVALRIMAPAIPRNLAIPLAQTIGIPLLVTARAYFFVKNICKNENDREYVEDIDSIKELYK